MFFVHHIVAAELLRLAGCDIDLFTFLELRDNAIDPVILVRGFLAGARND